MTPKRPVMKSQRLWRAPCGAAVLLLGLFFIGSGPAGADDVHASLRATYDAGQVLFRKGDAESLGQAFALLDAHKAQALDSVDFWTLYARVWIALKKDANELWSVVVAEQQRTVPDSVVFDLARARVETDVAKKKAAILSALERDPQSVPARTARAMLHLAEDEEDEADELLEAILEDDPHALGALIALARLYLSDGLPDDAIDYCDKALEKHANAAVHHLKALCYQRMAKNKPEAIKDALASAAEAMGLDPTEERITTFSDLLEQTGDAATAVKALRTHFGRTKHPLLGALLAESAFQAGDYEAALLGLSAGDGSDLQTAKGLAVAHARLGHAATAQAAAEGVIAVDSHGRLFAARLALFMGDAPGVQKQLGALADPDARRIRALAHAWRGEADAVKALVGKQVASGSREGEALLVAWLQARMLSHMDADLAEALRKKLLKARFAAGHRILAQEERGSVTLGEAVTTGWALRAVTHFRSRCGDFFKASSEGIESSWNFDGNEFYPMQSVTGKARCGDEDTDCTFSFNAKKTAGKSLGTSGVIVFGEAVVLKDFAPAEKAFAAGCKAYVGGDLKAAEVEFAKALKVEPHWSRVKVLRAVMRALAPNSEKRDEARAAKEAVAIWTDDFELRRLVIYLRAWAGDADLQAEVDALAEREAQYNVRNLSSL